MFIGVKEIKITDTISVLLLPLIYALVLGLALYLAKPIKFVGPKQSKVAAGNFVGRIKGAKCPFDLQFLTWDFS